MKIVGYGICAGGEAGRYMRQTMDEFKRLCDDTIILLNNATQGEWDLVNEYGFKAVVDNREWGKCQWLIKEDFLKDHVAKLNPDFCVCLDMDEVLIPTCTKEWIQHAPFDAYHVYVVDLWNDDKHYKPESCFWNVRLFRWNGDTSFKQKPVHCGLAPQWAYYYHRHAPFMLKHYGLMDKEDRQQKIARYEKYDPTAKHLGRVYYQMLKSDSAKPFNEHELLGIIESEVASYKETKPKQKMEQKKQRFAYLENPGGITVDVPERDVAQTLRRKGFKFLHWSTDVPVKKETYASTEDLKKDTDELNAKDEPVLPIVNEDEDMEEPNESAKPARRGRPKKNE